MKYDSDLQHEIDMLVMDRPVEIYHKYGVVLPKQEVFLTEDMVNEVIHFLNNEFNLLEENFVYDPMFDSFLIRYPMLIDSLLKSALKKFELEVINV